MKIDKNTPLPPRPSSNVRALLQKMEVGDSVLLPLEKEETLQQVINRYYTPARRLGMKVAFRREDDKVRMGRIE